MTQDEVDAIGAKLFKHMTGPSMPPVEHDAKSAMDEGLQLICLGIGALVRLADAAEALAPARAAENPHDGL